MLSVGVTGGIGSGKSVICMIFRHLGVPVYDADARAKELMGTDPGLQEKLRTTFGEEVLPGGQLDRQKLAVIVFNDEEQLQQLNAIVHPAVREDFGQWAEQQQAPYLIEEAAILIETGGHEHLDRLILVTAPEALRIQRVRERDGISQEAVRQRMQRQWPDEKKLPYADEVIRNDEQTPVLPEVLRIHEQWSDHVA